MAQVRNPGALTYVYVTLVFVSTCTQSVDAKILLAARLSWTGLVCMLNGLHTSYKSIVHLQATQFPSSNGPLPEDYFLNSFFWSQDLYPRDSKNAIPEKHDQDSIQEEDWREERVLWLAPALLLDLPGSILRAPSRHSQYRVRWMDGDFDSISV